MDLLVIVAALIAFLGGMIWFGMWTHRRLWRHAINGRYDEVVYGQGVRRFGTSMSLLFLISPLFTFRDDLGRDDALVLFFVQVFCTAVVGWPISLWGGYWWGRRMAASVGLKETHRPHN